MSESALPPAQYTRTAIALHWLIFGGIACAFALGWLMTDMAISPMKLKMYNWHKWLGVTILALAILRGIWRLTHSPPPFVPMPLWQQRLAHGLHVLLYLLLFAIPLSGWAYSNAVGYPIVYLGLWRLPDLLARNRELGAQLLVLHQTLGMVLLALLALHVAGALKHHLLDRDDTLKRMLRWRRVSVG